MSLNNFVHLHVHTLYSLLDSSIRHDALFQRAEEFKMPAVAMTDHGNLFGALEFHNSAKKRGIKPIIGCEVYVAPESRLERAKHDLRDASYHLILLAESDTGYKNLLKLVTAGYLEGFYYKPRIDKEMLAEHAEGLIALSSCSRGEIGHNLYRENTPRAIKMAAQYNEIMGAGNFFLELQYHKLENQERINKEMVQIGDKLSIPVVATNNCHYMDRKDFRAHEILLCLQTGKTIDDPYRMQYKSDEFYFKSPQEMIAQFRHIPDAITNTLLIADRCNVNLDCDQLNFPDYPVPEKYNLETYLEVKSREGLALRLEVLEECGMKPDKDIYTERLDEELKIINRMGYPGYFLIVWDFIHYAREQKIPVGPGRGSAAGSIVAYALKITDIDPMQFGLMFERFLNPERVSMPDIDIDFCMNGREKVIEYVTDKYGGNRNVTQIITFGSMNAKGVIRDVGRALDMSYGEVDKIAKMVPDRLNITLADSFKEEPQFAKLRKENEKVGELLDIAVNLEGLPRHCSTHAAGVVISSLPLTNFLPLYKGANDEVVTQFSMGNVEKLGLLKMDFLGLRTLTVIDNALRLIKESTGEDLDIERISIDDKKTYELLCDARTLGVFQLESGGMRDLLKKLKPDCFEDIIALLALYRPGPLESGMVDDYVKRKHGTLETKYEVPQLEEVLKETHGVILYQEQVMKIAAVLSGYSLGEADLLRRAMGKKKAEEMAAQGKRFMEGAKERKIPPAKAEKIFALIDKFAGYGFNKSHSAAYALVSYQTAYLKAHFPLQFFGALITSDMDNTDKVIRYIHDCRETNVEVRPPDINESSWSFSVSQGKLLFGLGAIKNVGSAAIEAIIKVRETEGRFNSLQDFCERVDLRVANKRVIESLIKSGACDSLGDRRAFMIKRLQETMEKAQAKQRDILLGQSSMFDTFDEDEGDADPLESQEQLSDEDRLRFEKETIGFYVSGHPLDKYEKEIHWFADAASATVSDHKNQTVHMIGLPAKVSVKTTKRGEKMGIVVLEDLQGSIEIILWPEIFSTVETLLSDDAPIWICGKVDAEGNTPKVIVDQICSLDDVKKNWKGTVHINIRTPGLEKSTMLEVRDVLANNNGTNSVEIHFLFPDNREKIVTVGQHLRVSPTDEVVSQIEKILGEDAIHFE